ncbi:5'-nucleotidase [Aureococcus anophagefferens]|uniref:5'-nucleotidase n=1 Tax=Aureococcus anophagefferens TaxID=44056 RepID=A0ABR1FN69_AURAN
MNDAAGGLLAAGAAAPADAGESATLRFIHVNDIYDLASLPSLATLVRDRSAGADRVVVTCGGDFLAPYLLSGLDHGTGMIDCLNALGCTHCCFGNHECDAPRGAGNGRRAPNRKGSSLGRFPLVPHAALLERIAQFGGVWINSNMPGITEGSPLHPLPEYDVVEVASRSGGHTRRVAVLGLLCDYAQLYRKSAFNGLAAAGGIEPPMDALKRLTGALRDAEKPDAVVAMTHLLDPEDDAICATGLCDAVLGGHDHAVTARASSGVPLAKAGMDATHAVVMDLSWSDARAATPAIRTTVERTADFAPDAEIAARVASHLAKVEAMDEMVLSSVRRVRRCAETNHWFGGRRDLFPGLIVDAARRRARRRASLRRSAADATPPLTSVGVRNGERSMATLLASIVAAELGADCCVLEAGGVRGNATYEASLTFAHLRAELPFENLMAVVPVDGASLSAFVRDSRDRPDLRSPRGYAFVLHGDVGLAYCPERKAVTTVRGEPLDPDRLYTVATCVDLGFGSGLCRKQPLVWVVLTKLENSLARSNQSRFG